MGKNKDIYISAESINEWLDIIKTHVSELEEESNSDDIGRILYDGNHDGYLREFKNYIEAIVSELDIKVNIT